MHHSYCVVLNKKTLLGPFVVCVSVICHNLHNCRIKLLLKFQGIMLYTDVAREFLAHSYYKSWFKNHDPKDIASLKLAPYRLLHTAQLTRQDSNVRLLRP